MIRTMVGGPAIDDSLALTFTDPTDAVTVNDFATMGKVYVVEACPLEPVIAGFGEKVPPNPSVRLMDAPGTTLPTASFALNTSGNGSVVPTMPLCFPPETTLRAATWPTTSCSVKLVEARPGL